MGYCARDGSGDGKAHYFPRVDLGPVIDHIADANARLSLTAEGVVVSGWGDPTIDGLYTQRGSQNDRPYYNSTSRPTDPTTYVISWSGSQWQLIIGATPGIKSFSTDDVSRPDLVTTWSAGGHGESTVVTHSPGQVTGAGYQVIQDADSGAGAGLTYTFGGDGADADAGLRVTGAGTTIWRGAYVLHEASTNQYDLISDPTVTQVTDPVSTGAWIMSASYLVTTPSTYPWEQPWDITPFTGGDPPAPTVQRNPIASEANWSHP